MKSETRFLFFLFAVAVVGFLVQYVLNVYLARHLSIEIYGDYSIAIKFLGILVSLALFGTDMGSQCFLSKYLRAHQAISAEHYIAWNIKLISISFLFARLLALISFTVMIGLHFFGVKDIHQYPIVVFVLWVTPFAAAFQLLSNFLLSEEFIFSSMLISSLLIYLLQFLLFFIIINVLQYQPDYLIIALILGLSNLILSIVIMTLLNRDIVKMIRLGIKNIKITPIVKSFWFNRSAKLILNNIIYLLILSLDLFIVKLCSKNALDVGVYAAILTITSLIWLVPNNLYQKIKPMMSIALSTEKGRVKLQTKLNQTNKIVFIIITTVSLLIISFSTELLSFFGENYVQGKPALIILTIGSWYAGLNQISGIILLYADFEGLVVRISLIELSAILLFTPSVTYWFGINGTAIVTAVVIGISKMTFVLLVNRKLGIKNMGGIVRTGS